VIAGKTITLIITGSIAAYKSAELVRELTKSGAKVQAVMTKSACEFITPLTIQSLAGSRVTVDIFDPSSEAEISHIELADSADVVLVAPASADIIAKAAHGVADDIATTLLLATKAPVIFAPAMNVNMWENPLTRENVTKLKTLGCDFVDPGEGELACGWIGKGRFADTDDILDSIRAVLSPKTLAGARVIVTAGPTREAIDPVRFVSNRSTGRMGFALARVARWLGAEVTLVTGPSEIASPQGMSVVRVISAQDMYEAVFEEVVRQDTGLNKTQFVFMAAAITDHRPAGASATKIKKDKSKTYELKMEPCLDVLQELGANRERIEDSSGLALKLVGFSAETGDEEQLLAWAREKLERKNADLMVGNFADDAFGQDTNRIWLLEKDGRQEEVSTAEKHMIAGRIIRAALRV